MHLLLVKFYFRTILPFGVYLTLNKKMTCVLYNCLMNKLREITIKSIKAF